MNCRRSFTIEKWQRRETLAFNTRLSSKTWRWDGIIIVIFMFLCTIILQDVLCRTDHIYCAYLFTLQSLHLTMLSLVNSSRYSWSKWTDHSHVCPWVVCVQLASWGTNTTGRCTQAEAAAPVLFAKLSPIKNRIQKYEKRFRSVFSSTHTDLSKCSNEAVPQTSRAHFEDETKHKEEVHSGGTFHQLVSDRFNGFGIEMGWQSSCFITSQSPVRFGNWAYNVAFLLSPTSWNRSPRTSDAKQTS